MSQRCTSNWKSKNTKRTERLSFETIIHDDRLQFTVISMTWTPGLMIKFQSGTCLNTSCGLMVLVKNDV